jgi:hypothetical protein
LRLKVIRHADFQHVVDVLEGVECILDMQCLGANLQRRDRNRQQLRRCGPGVCGLRLAYRVVSCGTRSRDLSICGVPRSINLTVGPPTGRRDIGGGVGAGLFELAAQLLYGLFVCRPLGRPFKLLLRSLRPRGAGLFTRCGGRPRGFRGVCPGHRRHRVGVELVLVGDNSIFLASRGYSVTGLDGSTAAIEQARSRAAEAGVTVAHHFAVTTDDAKLEI